MKITTKQMKLEDLSKVKYEVHIGNSNYRKIMIIKFIGSYGDGSRGDSDAIYMSAMGKAALEAWRPRGVIIDLSELDYQWGDELDRVFDIGSGQYSGAPFPTAVLVGKNSEEAIRTLILGINSPQNISELDGSSKI